MWITGGLNALKTVPMLIYPQLVTSKNLTLELFNNISERGCRMEHSKFPFS